MPTDQTSDELVSMTANVIPVPAAEEEGARFGDLSGAWRVRLDEGDEGIGQKWFTAPVVTEHTVNLPGSLAASGLGHPYDPDPGRYRTTGRPYLRWPSAGYTDATRVDELGALVPTHHFIGPAWYERTIEIPANRAGTSWEIRLERVKWTSRAWLDGIELPGEGTDSLHVGHSYVTPPLGTGPHLLTLRIDNRPPCNIGLAGHGYGMETEPIWHGVAGKITMQPLGDTRFDRVRLDPRPDGSIQVVITGRGKASPTGDVSVEAWLTGPEAGGQGERVIKNSGQVSFADPTAGAVGSFSTTLVLRLKDKPERWDEFDPTLYRLDLKLFTGDDFPVDTRTLRIGFREFKRDGNRLLLNGVPIFLRGNLDCAIHPESDTPPTDRAWWERVLGIHKAAGFNHLRLHTWCPPEVAFAVADELGLYLLVETAYWVDDWIHDTAPNPPRIGEDEEIDAWVLAESRRIIHAYGHHPSFMMFCLGNEFGMGSDWDALERIVAELREQTDTILIAATTARKTVDSDEYWITHHSGASTRGLGPAHSAWDFSAAVAATEKPVISHETGQRQSWPDYDSLIPAFTGPIQPHNLTRLRARAEAAGITDHRARCEASARFAHLLYKHEHEAMRRTPGLAGYQLLMLHDFTGQGEAHVGLLDPFFREKPGITLEGIKAWNGPTVPLARMPKFIWESDETLEADMELAHAGPDPLGPVEFTASLTKPGGRVVHRKNYALNNKAVGDNVPLGSFSCPLESINEPTKLTLTVSCDSPAVTNSWPVWVYPSDPVSRVATFEGRLTKEALASLASGETVLLSFHKAAGGQFQQTRWGSTFWTGAWGWGSGLGLMCDPDHPALAGFPNDGHSDWQWGDLAEGATCIELPSEPAEAATIVEQISTFHQPTRQAFLVEARVGKGRLLACGFDLDRDLVGRPAARAFRESILNYAKSSKFQPSLAITPAEAAVLFATPEPLAAVARADSEAPGFEASKAIDGDPSTFWHTRWGAIEPPHPHELVVEFKDAISLRGVRLRNRSDMENGRPSEISLFLTNKRDDWGTPVLDHIALENTAERQTLEFASHEARFIRLLIHREVQGRPFASLAELQPIPDAPDP